MTKDDLYCAMDAALKETSRTGIQVGDAVMLCSPLKNRFGDIVIPRFAIGKRTKWKMTPFRLVAVSYGGPPIWTPIDTLAKVKTNAFRKLLRQWDDEQWAIKQTFVQQAGRTT